MAGGMSKRFRSWTSEQTKTVICFGDRGFRQTKKSTLAIVASCLRMYVTRVAMETHIGVED